MDWKDLAGTIANYAPLVGTAVGGPIGAAAGTAVKILAGLFGIKSPDPKPEELAAAIQADPQAAAKLLAAENEYKLEVAKMEHEESMAKMAFGLEEIKVGLADVQSARSREVEITKATGKRDINLYALAWVIMGGFIGLIMCMLILQYAYGKILQNDPLLTLLLGALSTDAGMVVGYFFGSSKSSRDKDQTIANSLKTPT